MAGGYVIPCLECLHCAGLPMLVGQPVQPRMTPLRPCVDGTVALPEPRDPVELPADPRTLTVREYEVLQHLGRGESNKEMARALGISDQTVKNHLTSLYRKLEVEDRSQAVIYGLKRGWIVLE